MKKFLLVAGLVLAGGAVKAQITREHRYPMIVVPGKLSTGDVKYAGYVYTTATSGQVNIYNSNHSLFKQANIAVPTGMFVESIQYLSDHLFNNNASLEFVVNLQRASNNTTNPFYMLRVFDESGAQLLATDTTAYPQIFNSPSGTKMLLSYSGGVSRIFGLGGTLTPLAATPSGSVTEARQAYPNPTSAEIHLPYTVKAGLIEPLKVYDIAGRQVATYQVDSTFDSLLFDTRGLRSGVYFYTVGTGTAQRFLIQ